MDTIKTVKVVVVGESGAGKTALLTSFLENHFETDPLTTIGIDFKHKIVQLNDGQSIRLQLWDTAGQERFRQLTPAYIRSSKVALLVLDLSDQNCVEHLVRWKGIIDKNKSDFTATIIVGNKCDLVNDKRPPRLTNIIKETKDDYIETSAKTRKNIKELFSMVACRPFPEHKTSQIILLNEPRPSESETRRCCQSS
ncbi:hypothetical protein L5515_004569 [Caenorhabditis briggsae]|uniref:Uncharacterized protein n=1 Tax=Caenorhabditis briggsae TaxID=6238 RepID=A0AAE9IQJ8_CAEBR|nr:hypothetical protein L3Y34_001724 [Caenorhabditis briggsae]UMM24239.1 hypothetical protein L5515_004569 [Caenorhabditis briggsae]